MDTATQVTCTTASALPRRRSFPATQTVNNHDRYYDFLLPIFQMISPQRLPAVLALMQRLESVSINKYTQSVQNVGGNLSTLEQQAIFLQVLSALTPAGEGAGVNSLAQTVMQYIQANYAKKISLSDIAAVTNYHPTHIIRCLKQQYGTTPAKAILDFRLQNACTLLDTSDLSVAEIAELSGFASSAYFCKVFRAHMNATPQAYRIRSGKIGVPSASAPPPLEEDAEP